MDQTVSLLDIAIPVDFRFSSVSGPFGNGPLLLLPAPPTGTASRGSTSTNEIDDGGDFNPRVQTDDIACSDTAAVEADLSDPSDFSHPSTIDVPVDTRSHVEVNLRPNFATVSDCGRKHPDNQDSVGLAAVDILVSPIDVPPIYVAVICDGVSCSEAGASASMVAVDSAVALLESTFTRNPDANPREQLERAINSAQEAVCAIPCATDTYLDPPATTIVAAIVVDGMATIGWVGDSRAYWVKQDSCGLLTRDHSWINAMMDAGKMTEEEAAESPNRNALFHCLCSAEEEPLHSSFTTFAMAPGTRLVLCSDGFWNYAPRAQDVARLVRQTPAGDSLKTAKHLVNYAIAGGGHDNISVAVLGI